MGLLWLVWVGCPRTSTSDPPPQTQAPHTFRFAHVAAADGDTLLTAPRVSPSASIDGSDYPVSYQVLWRAGDDGFGVVPAGPGAVAPAEACGDQDFNSLLPVGTGAALVSHFECVPGAAYVTRLDVDAAGIFTKKSAAPVSWDDWRGLWFPCSGQLSPWKTHLGSEEYEPNAAMTGKMGPEEGRAWQNIVAYFGGDASRVQPYRYGWATEIAVPEQGDPIAQKHFALGRFSHELSYVLPDQRTVVQSDDGTAVGLFLFVADAAADLSAGTLYAARFGAAPEGSPADTASISWISLGHATHSEIAAAVERGVTFADLFDRIEVPAEGGCPEGYRYVDHHYGRECLALQKPSEASPDVALLASRLETRRYAAWLGASTELEKGEGVTFDPETGRVYLALSSLARRALKEDGAPNDTLQLQPNPCGAVMALPTSAGAEDTDGKPIASELVPTLLFPEISGRLLPQPSPSGDLCDPEGIANPDNITFLEGYGQLIIAEDTRRHYNASLWAWSTRERSLARIVLAPHGGELTGIHWIPDLHGHAYLTLAIQHPWSELPDAEALPEGVQADDQRTFTGYLGPFPALKEIR